MAVFLCISIATQNVSLAQTTTDSSVGDTTDPLLTDPSLKMPVDTGQLPPPSPRSADTVSQPDTDDPSLDNLNLNVNKIDGSVIWRSDTETVWRRLDQGDSVQQGDELIVADGGTVTLTVPGVSAIKLEPGSVIKVTWIQVVSATVS